MYEVLCFGCFSFKNIVMLNLTTCDMKRFYYLLFIYLVAACGNDDESSPLDNGASETLSVASAVTIVDVANFGDARDIELRFASPGDLSNITGFKGVIVPIDKVATFDLSATSSLGDDRVFSMPRSQGGESIRLAQSLKDSEGNDLREGVNYQIFILSLSGDSDIENALSEPSNQLTLEQKTAVYTLANISGGSGGMDVDANGNVYMADFGATLSGNPHGTKVFRITPTGGVSTFANGLQGASGNDFDADGNLIQSSIAGGTVSLITPGGQANIIASGLAGPVGVAVLDDGDILVCNCGGNTIGKISPSGSVTTFASGSSFNCPNGIDVDGQGNAYVANFSDGRVIKITPNGTTSTFTTIPGGNNGHLLIKGDFVYVVARGSNQIYKVTLSGSASVFAGTGERGLRNGSADQATFSLPNDIAFSPDGTKMYVNDVRNISGANSTIAPVVVRVIDLVE